VAVSWTSTDERLDDGWKRIDKGHHLRGALLVSVVMAGFLGVGVRLVWLQAVDRTEYATIAEEQRQMKRVITARRGAIYDRVGRPLSVSVKGNSVYLVPRKVKHTEVPEVAGALARVLELDATELAREIAKRHRKRFMWVKRRVSRHEAEAVEALGYAFVGTRTEYRRTLPQGAVAAHVLGFVDVDERGCEGLERTYDALLRGEDGYEELECDGGRRPLLTDRAAFKPVRHGKNLHLTIDTEVQRLVERELHGIMEEWAPASATVIVMEVRTGRILALANRPSYNPTRPAEDDPEGRRRFNRAVCAQYEPGSIFKPFVMAGYLDAGIGRIDDQIFCENGLFRYRARRLRDHHPFDYLTVAEVLSKSSNVGMAKIGLAMGPERLYGTLIAFGFGQETGCGLPGEVDGDVTSLADWSYYTTTSVPMGHEVEATPMQLITAFNAIANDGVLVQPQVVDGVFEPDGRVVQRYEGPEITMRVISSATARTMIDPLMTGVIEQGTGRRAQLGVYRKFGKTGTAQKVVDGEFSHSRFVSSFLCGAPAAAPRVTVLVLVDDPSRGDSHYGGTVAAPPAARIIEDTLRYLQVPAGPMARHHNL
jgi:cell division protein FtsI/penicillin-binding protein 2